LKAAVLVQSSRVFCQAAKVYDIIDTGYKGSISKLDLLKAVQRCKDVSDFVLPEVDCSDATRNEQAFEAVSSIFSSISGGKRRATKHDFVKHFSQNELESDGTAHSESQISQDLRAQLRIVFSIMDSDGDGAVSKLDLLHAVRHHASVAELLLPGTDHVHIMRNASLFDSLDDLFGKISKGKKQIDLSDVVHYFCSQLRIPQPLKVPVLQHSRPVLQRSAYKVLLISTGFGRKLNPQQAALVENSGFQIHWSNVPNPEDPGVDMHHYIRVVKADIDCYCPDLLVSASKGGLYVRALWNSGLWRGATLMLNAEPGLKELPKGVPIVIAHGQHDELYQRSRGDLEQLVSTGSRNMCFLYTSVTSGKVGYGVSRRGDMHNMESLLSFDCLPRLMESALSPPPEMHMMQSWRRLLGEERLRAEERLGCTPADLRRFWASSDGRGMDSKKTFEVPAGSEEFKSVSTAFFSAPKESPYYSHVAGPVQMAQWANTEILKIERVENGPQMSGSAQPYYESLRKCIEDQGLAFEPGVHTRWAFHGTAAVDSIISNPISGFQPLTSGARVGTVWGTGTYFARDAKYVLDAGFVQPEADGSRRMLVCLLLTGMSCIGDPKHTGLLPHRQKPHHYNSSVDSLNSPEVFIMQHPSSAYPAYVITFK
jgi:poly [ADP-ribose] polymerase 10/14/15